MLIYTGKLAIYKNLEFLLSSFCKVCYFYFIITIMYLLNSQSEKNYNKEFSIL